MTTCTGCRHAQHVSVCPECACGVCAVPPSCVGCSRINELSEQVQEIRAILLGQATDLHEIEKQLKEIER